MTKHHPFPYLLFFLITFSFLHINAQTTLEKNGPDWNIIVGGRPFEIKGVTFGYTDDVKNYDSHFQDLNFLGVNTIRLWATDENTGKLLDAAHKHDIKVMVGIWMRHAMTSPTKSISTM